MNRDGYHQTLSSEIIPYYPQYHHKGMSHHTKKLIDSYLIGLIMILIFMILLKIYWMRKSQKGLCKKLFDAGWRLYVMDGCDFCDEQLMILGTRKYPEMVNCTKPADNCTGIRAFPA